ERAGRDGRVHDVLGLLRPRGYDRGDGNEGNRRERKQGLHVCTPLRRKLNQTAATTSMSFMTTSGFECNAHSFSLSAKMSSAEKSFESHDTTAVNRERSSKGEVTMLSKTLQDGLRDYEIGPKVRK